MQRFDHPDLVVDGFRCGTASFGLKSGNRPDIAVLVSDRPCSAAMVSTQNPFAAAPLHVSRQHAADGRAQAIVVNAGNANACTGRQGLRDALGMARAAADALGLEPHDVLVASTGIIGEPLPPTIHAGVRAACQAVADGEEEQLARAILTTDSGPKTAVATGDGYKIAGIAKGAGMIHPNMATMLAFITTDAAVAPKHLQQALADVTKTTFNQISVDGDESTNDMVAVLANGASGTTLAPGDEGWDAFTQDLRAVCQQLATQIAADGEGATRLLEVVVDGTADDVDARRAARAVAASNLVKAAVHGRDPNWGRILAAAGQTRALLDNVKVHIGDKVMVCVYDGGPTGAEEAAREAMGQSRVRIQIEADGPGHGTAWGCDLTADYVAFNAEYRS